MNKDKELKLLEAVTAARNANKSKGIDFAWDTVDMSLDWDDLLAFAEKYAGKFYLIENLQTELSLPRINETSDEDEIVLISPNPLAEAEL
jgi:hypothetical protein